MRTTTTGEAKYCGNCGGMLAQKICPSCTPIMAHHVREPDTTGTGGWSSLPKDLLQNGEANGVFSVAWSFLRHPVDTIIRLTDDPTYRSHWSFLSACLGMQLTLTYVLLPRLSELLYGSPTTSDQSAIFTTEVVQYAGIAILTPIQFYICRALGKFRRTPMSYLKLCVLSVSYCTIISAAVAIAYVVAVVTLQRLAVAFDSMTLGNGLTSLGQIAIVAFVTASHRRFWGMRWLIALSVTLVIAALSWLVVYPALTSLAIEADIAAKIARVFG
ncbi:MAG: hypothetical protein ACKVP4_08415 [Hyphomicrobium sp.]